MTISEGLLRRNMKLDEYNKPVPVFTTAKELGLTETHMQNSFTLQFNDGVTQHTIQRGYIDPKVCAKVHAAVAEILHTTDEEERAAATAQCKKDESDYAARAVERNALLAQIQILQDKLDTL